MCQAQTKRVHAPNIFTVDLNFGILSPVVPQYFHVDGYISQTAET